MIGTRSRPAFALLIMLIIVVIMYVVRKKMSLSELVHAACITLIFLMVIGGVRLLYDDISIVRNNQKLLAESGTEKRVFDGGNYIGVTEQVRKHLDLDSIHAWKENECTIYAKSNAERPFNAHRSSVYLRPCTVVKTGSMADYHLYFNVLPETQSGTLVLSGTNFTLYDLRP